MSQPWWCVRFGEGMTRWGPKKDQEVSIVPLNSDSQWVHKLSPGHWLDFILVTLVDVVWFFWFLDQNVPVYSLGIWHLTPMDWLFCNKKTHNFISGVSFFHFSGHDFGGLSLFEIFLEASTLRLLYYHLADAVILLLGEDSDTEDPSSLGKVKPKEAAWKHPIVVWLKGCINMRCRYTHHIAYTHT